MCTLTFIPQKEGFILTSSRDEIVSRPTLSPKEYTLHQQNLVFPKDELKGGTWLVMGKNRVICVLNGSEKKFTLKENYTESRGKLVLNHFKFENSEQFLEETSFENVAPFTMVIFNLDFETSIEEISWNGSEKQIQYFNRKTSKIWSSATLYSKEKREEREIWFSKFLAENNLEERDLLHFHQQEHTSESATNILMKRSDGKQTTSISQISVSANENTFFHHDLLNNSTSKILWTKEEMDSPSL
ncbi:NRDE family protein [Chryseobacterium sp. MP_3.2]|uniref:NRDE family protein n=1 Tax=Chryseobacterium sp. MP_3.2 TaxID=3071712 RepID=UPI002E00BD02|nr:uncharacterized protein with NRDE domain [Chryseobacterium sp. MP_3.2]